MRHKLLMLATAVVCAAVTLVDPHYPTNAAGTDSITSPDTAGEVGAFTSSPTAVPGLVAHWSFDEGSGTTVSDSSGNGNNGSTVGGPTWVQGHSGSALQFDGVDDYVDIPDSASLDVRHITIEAWVKPDVDDQLDNIVSKWKGGSPGQRSYNLNLGNSNPPTFYPRKASFCISTDGEMDGEVHLVDTSDIPVGLWTHIAGTYDGTVMKIYVNGQLESSRPQTGDIFAGTARLFIADADDGAGNRFDGAIDEVSIYDRALTAQEIQDEYQPPVGYWKFDEGSGTTVSDSSSNGNNGSTVGGPSWVQGHSGSALQFDGVDDYVDIPDSASLDVRHITIEAWVKPDVNDQLVNLVGKWTGGSPGQRSYVLNLGGSNPPTFYPRKAAFCISTDGEMDGEVHLVGTSDIPVGLWTHIAETYDGNIMKIYVNGQLESSRPQTGDIFAGTARLFIADADDSAGNRFDGAIDEVKIYDRALTAQEIREQFGGRAVGGIAEFPDAEALPLHTTGSSGGSSSATHAAVAFVATGAVLLAASAWYARRRWPGWRGPLRRWRC